MKHFYESIPGGFWFKPAYDKLLAELAPTAAHIIEVGSFHGKSAAYLGVEILNRQLPWHLYCVDDFSWQGWVPSLGNPRAECHRNLEPLVQAGIVTIVPINSVTAARVCPGLVNAVWIDADHSYEGVRADIAAWLPKLVPGGIMGGDDYEMEGVKRAVQESGPFELVPGYRADPMYKGEWPSWWRRA